MANLFTGLFFKLCIYVQPKERECVKEAKTQRHRFAVRCNFPPTMKMIAALRLLFLEGLLSIWDSIPLTFLLTCEVDNGLIQGRTVNRRGPRAKGDHGASTRGITSLLRGGGLWIVNLVVEWRAWCLSREGVSLAVVQGYSLKMLSWMPELSFRNLLWP